MLLHNFARYQGRALGAHREAVASPLTSTGDQLLTSEADNLEAAAWITELWVAVVTWLVAAVALVLGIVLGLGPSAEFWLVLFAVGVTYAVGALATLDEMRVLRVAAGPRALAIVLYLVILALALPQVVSVLHIERIDLLIVFVILPTLELVILAVWYPGGVRFRRPLRR